MNKATIPLSLYIHIPWCIKKCPYCDFNSYSLNEALPEEAYIQALFRDFEQDLPLAQGRSLKSIFFGGGTPSLFSPKSIGKIREKIQARLNFDTDIEITLEANPGTLEHKNFKDYKSAGINRVSLGAQSFQDDKLKALGRIHNAENIKRAIQLIEEANLNSFNLDIMYGLPNQTITEALFDIKTALSFSPPHLSWYHLTIEPNTIFHHKPPILPADDSIYEMQNIGYQCLKDMGLKQYEVSAFSRPNQACQHNLNYWEYGDYLGIGAGAHSKITNLNTLTITRLAKTRYPKSYLTPHQSLIAESKIIPIDELPFEFMLNALRLSQGISKSLFEARTGIPLKNIEENLKLAVETGLLQISDTHIIPTDFGKRFLNDLIAMFLPKPKQ